MSRRSSSSSSRNGPIPTNDRNTALSTSSSTPPSSSSSSSSPSKKKFVNFWGTHLSTGEDTDATSTTTKANIPCVETLDLYDGPLPVGAYHLLDETKSQFDPKRTCRISLNVQLDNNNNNNHRIDPMGIVRHLQSCIDAGFQTFELQHQTVSNMNVMAMLRKHTPSYVETHWSIKYQIPTHLVSHTACQQQKEIRNSVLSLLHQKCQVDDAIDSLQVHCGGQRLFSPYTLDTLDYLIDLQREGLIRSIGLQPCGPSQSHPPQQTRSLLRQIHNAGMSHVIDFNKQPGNLLLPPEPIINYESSGGVDHRTDFPHQHWWIEDALAGRLLRTLLKHPQQMQSKEYNMLREWDTRREQQFQPGFHTKSHRWSSSLSQSSQVSVTDLWQRYQEQVVDTLQWIGLKYRVPPAAVALRWALEKGSSHHHYLDSNGGKQGGVTHAPIIASVMMDCSLSSADTFVVSGDWSPVEWRKVFRFQFDEEDVTLLQNIPAPSWEVIQRQEEQRRLLSTSSSSPLPNNVHGNPEDALNDWERELLEYHREEEENKVWTPKKDDYPDIDFNNQALWL
jgi:hypothetical protein